MFFFGALERNITPCVSVSKFPLGCFLVLHEITSFKMVFDLLFATEMFFFFFSGNPGTSFRVFIYIFRIVDNWFFQANGYRDWTNLQNFKSSAWIFRSCVKGWMMSRLINCNSSQNRKVSSAKRVLDGTIRVWARSDSFSTIN